MLILNSVRKWMMAAVFLAAVVLPTGVYAQQTVIGKVKNFSISPEFHKPPYQSQMKSLLQGAEAVPSAGGHVITIKSGKLQTFQENGRREMLVEAPQCVYEDGKRTISSDGTLTAQTADGRFSIEGQGFLWQTTNSSLLISNQVRTFVHPDLLQSTSPEAKEGAASAVAPGQGLEITSEQFEFLSDQGLAIYRGNVRVAGTNMTMSAGTLTLSMPLPEGVPTSPATNDAVQGPRPSPLRVAPAGRQVDTITAQDNVQMDHAGVHASGQKVVYSAQTEIIRVFGQPAWQADQREGRADEVTIDRSNHIFMAKGNSWLKLPGQTLGPANLLPSDRPAQAQPRSTNSFLEISSAGYELHTNWGVFEKNVRVVERRGEAAAGSMDCDLMRVTFSGTNQLDRLEANNNVVINQEDKRLAGSKLVYTSSDGMLSVTGDPSWQYAERRGKGDLILINSRAEEMLVKGNASMRLPASEFGQLTAPIQGKPDPVVADSSTNTAAFADLFSEEYTFGPRQARFVGGVYISHPRMNWACEDLTFQFPSDRSGQIERIVANQSVTFDLLDRNAQKVHGKGEKAVYTYNVSGAVTNDFVELTGNPVLERVDKASGNPVIVRNKILILDRARNQVIAPGQYNIRGWGKLSSTNFVAPGTKIPFK